MSKTDFTGNDISSEMSSGSRAEDCRENCTHSDRCQFFTFEQKGNGNVCYLKASPAGTTSINITYSQTKTSGYSLRSCSGKVIYPAKKYSLVSEGKNWTEARAYCQQHYTDLASIHTAADLEAVTQELRNSMGVWIGLHREGSAEPWAWSTGENLTYFKWKHGYPTINGYKCVFSFKSTWEQIPCNATNIKNHVCQDVHQVNGTTTKSYENIAGGTTLHMLAAQLDCESRNKTLASILNQEEQEAFDEVAQSEMLTWIGLHYNQTIDKWKWSSEEPFEALSDSLKGQKNCVKYSKRKWKLGWCHQNKRFLCFDEKNAVNDTTKDPTTSTPDYLHYYNTPKTWLAALEFCKDQHSTLVHITNSTVQKDVSQLLDSEDLPWGVWIGLERYIFQSNARWVWVSGVEVNFTQWHQCFPLNTPTLYCGKMIWDDDDDTLKWLGASCQEELPFICQDLHH
ncbi:macrophage mannose receptor 1-like isoform X2 [Osmerus eperlanus]